MLRLITKLSDGQFKVPLVILAKVEDLSMKVRIRESTDLIREKDTCQSFLERYNSELQACHVIKLLYRSAKVKLA